MAKQNKGGGQPQNQGPKSSFVVEQKTKETNGKIELTLFISLAMNGRAADGATIRVIKDLKEWANGTLDNNGETTITKDVDADMVGKTVVLKIKAKLSDNTITETNVSVEVPELKSAPKPKGPDGLRVQNYCDGKGGYSLVTVVTDIDGNCLKDETVSFIWRGKAKTRKTDAQGIAKFVVDDLRLGEKQKAIFRVSGVANAAELTLRRPKKKRAVKRWSSTWWFKTNNGRAHILWILCLAFLGYNVYMGIGDPVVAPSQLTAQQQMWNEVTTAVHGSPEFPAPVKEASRVGSWLVFAVFFLFSLVYSMLSTREELYEAVHRVLLKAMERDSAYVHDSLFIRVMSWAGQMAIAKNAVKSKPAKEKDGEDKPAGKFGISWSKLVSAEIVAELLAEAIPAILGGLMKR